MDWLEDLNYEETGMVLLEITKHFLVSYFEHESSYADEMISRFFEDNNHVTEELVHHKSAWGMASAIHYCSHLNGSLGALVNWEVENGFLNPPPSAVAYVKEHYWDRFIKDE